LNRLKNAGKNNENLMKYSINAIKARATIGEITNTLTELYGEYNTTIFSINNIYKSNFSKNMILKSYLRKFLNYL